MWQQIHGFCFIDPTGHVCKFSLPRSFVSPDGSIVLIGSQGELLSEMAPATISGAPLSPKHFVTLATQEAVDFQSLPHFPLMEHDPL